METPTIWRLNNSHGLFWEGRIDAYYTTQNMWIRDNKYTSGNRVSLTTTSNPMKIFQEMAIWTKYDMARDIHAFPDWGVSII